MSLHLRKEDLLFMAGGLVAVTLAAVLAHLMQWPRMVELLLDIVTALLGVVSAYFIYRATGTYGGKVGRYLALIGIGIAYYSITLIPHVQLHIFGFTGIGPIKGLSIFFSQHILAAWSFLLMAYGFFLFWRGGRA